MLLIMRKRVGSIIVKVFAFILILGFGAWGIQDMLGYQVGGGGAIAEVGKARLGPNRLYREVNQEIARLRPMFGNQLDMETARRLGLVDMVLNRQIDTLATMVGATDLGVAISDTLVRRVIVEEPSFEGLAGNFDRQRFQQVLQSTGLTEAGYVDEIRATLARQQVLGSLAAGAVAPKAWVNAVYRFRQEKRVVESVFVADKDSGALAEPTDSQVRAHYDANKDAYTAPEYRAVSYVSLDVEEMANEIAIDEASLRDAFDRRGDEFTTLEKRNVRQMILSDEGKAKTAYQRVKEGADFLAVAKEIAGQDATAVELGEVTKSDLLSELAEPVFALASGMVTEPVKSALGWHIVQVTAITPGGAMGFDDAREKLRADIAHEKAIDGIYELSNKFEDALGGGATLEEAAAQLNLKIVKIPAIDAKGLDRAGNAVDGLPGGAAFAATAFATEEQTESHMTEAGEQGFFMVRIDKVTKPALRPFDEVRAKVVESWQASQRREQAEARAKTITSAVNAGKPLAEVIATMPLQAEESKPLTRDGRGGEGAFDAPLTAEVFKLTVGKAAMGRVGDGYRIAVLKSVTTPDPAADKKGVEELRQALQQSLQGDIATRMRVAFREEAGVKVYQTAIDQLFGANQQR